MKNFFKRKYGILFKIMYRFRNNITKILQRIILEKMAKNNKNKKKDEKI